IEWMQQRHRGSTEALWRILAQHPNVDREAVFAAAAEVYAFREVALAKADMLAFIQGVLDVFTEQQWAQMIQLRMLPVALEDEQHSDDRKLVIATNDPA